jgi:cytidine deaminase
VSAQPQAREDATLVALARSARARVGALSGAAVRDTDGRTYAAAPSELPSVRLSAIQLAVAMAASAGAQGLEAVAVVADEVDPADLVALHDLGGGGVRVLVVDTDGTVAGTVTT